MEIRSNEKLNELAKKFKEKDARKEIVENFKSYNGCFWGENKNGEDIELHIATDGILLKTYQENGHVRVDAYNAEGTYSGTTYEGCWK